MEDLEVGDTVEHRGSERRGVVLEVGKTWYGLAVAFVELREPSGRLVGYEIPRAALRLITRRSHEVT